MNWYETAFQREYLDLYYKRDDKSAKAEAEFTAAALGLREGSRILDIACGGGRHARALEALGPRSSASTCRATCCKRRTG